MTEALSKNQNGQKLGYLSRRKLLEKFLLCICLPKNKVARNLDVSPTVSGSYQDFEGTEVIRVGIESL
jgi:hypothetical protein